MEDTAADLHTAEAQAVGPSQFPLDGLRVIETFSHLFLM